MEFILDFPSQLILKGEDYTLMKYGVSEEEFWELSKEDTNFELIDGVLIIHSPASTEHEEIFNYLTRILGFYLEEQNLGKVFGSRLVMRLSPKWNPEPDLMVILKENYKRIKKSRINGPADLVIEILSPSTRDLDLTKKVPYYLKSGVREIWIVDPLNKEFVVFQEAKEERWNEENSDRDIKSKVIPRLKFKPKWIWERGKYPTNWIIKELMKP